jgi:hypothetical protein
MTHTDQHTQPPGAPRGRRRPRTRTVSVRTVLGSAGAVAMVAGAAALGVLTLGVDDQNEVATGHPLATEPDGSRATQRRAQDQAGPPGGRAPACWWTSKVNTPVLPVEDLGGPPTAESVLILQRCNGEWTGNIAWLNPDHAQDQGPAASAAVSGGARDDERFAKCVKAETGSRAAVSSSDDGLPNPWEAGSIAAKCHLEQGHEDQELRDP